MWLWWMSLAGLGLLLVMWASALIGMIRGGDLPKEMTLDKDDEPDDLPPLPPSLSVVVPARNEAHNIERCVKSAMELDWPGTLQMVVIDDRSDDGTGEILGRLVATHGDRLLVVQGADPPQGWLGKPHALHLAALHARGDWLLFVDADVELHKRGPLRLVARAIRDDAVMASALGRLVVESFWERVIQTRMGAVIAGGNPIEKVNDPENEAALANGQCLLFTREAYDELGGHESIKGSVLDDVDFAKRAKEQGIAYRLYYGPGVFSCRMYTGFNEIWQGWTKNLFPALHYSLVVTLIVTLLLFSSSLLPFVLVAKNLIQAALGRPPDPVFFAIEVATVALIFLVDAVGHHVHGYRWGMFWTFPLGMAIVIALFWNSAWRIKSGRGAVWKGRVVEAGGISEG